MARQRSRTQSMGGYPPGAWGGSREERIGPGHGGADAAADGAGGSLMDLDLALAGIIIVALAAVWLIPS
jgi:hypothetical protein